MSLLVEGEKPNQMNIFKILALGFVTIIFMGIAFVLWSTNGFVVDAPEIADSNEEDVVLDGTLFISLGTVSTSTGQRDLVPALFRPGGQQFMRLPIDTLKGESITTLQYNVSPESEYAVFLGLPLTEATASSGEFGNWNVYRTHLRGLTGGQQFIQSVESVSEGFAGDESDYYRQGPVVSANGSVLYASLSEEDYIQEGVNLEALPAEYWQVYLINPDSTKRLVTRGIKPKWINETSFAFLKNDGVYIYDLNTNTQHRVYDAAHLTILNGFDVSNDGNYFALSNLTAQHVEIMEVSDWQNGVFKSNVWIPEVATNPVFSPDNKYVAMVVVRPDATKVSGKAARLEYFSLQAEDFLDENVPFDNETIDGIYLTDWQ